MNFKDNFNQKTNQEDDLQVASFRTLPVLRGSAHGMPATDLQAKWLETSHSPAVAEFDGIHSYQLALHKELFRTDKFKHCSQMHTFEAIY